VTIGAISVPISVNACEWISDRREDPSRSRDGAREGDLRGHCATTGCSQPRRRPANEWGTARTLYTHAEFGVTLPLTDWSVDGRFFTFNGGNVLDGFSHGAGNHVPASTCWLQCVRWSHVSV